MIKRLYVFLEEHSAKIVLEQILPKILPENVWFQIFSHQGKQDLEKALRTTLPSISRMPNARIIVARDQDSSDCKILKKQLFDIISLNCSAPYTIRIICRELECWYLGDLNAIQTVFPRFKSSKYENKEEFRNVDNIQNAPQILKNIIPEYVAHDYLPKVECATKIAPRLDIENNKSASFQQFISGVIRIINQ